MSKISLTALMLIASSTLFSAHAMTSEELGTEAANLLLHQPRLTTKDLDQLVDEAFVLEKGYVNDFVKGFFAKNYSNQEKLSEQLAEYLHLDSFASRAIVETFFYSNEKDSVRTKHFVLRMTRKIVRGPKDALLHGMLPALDALISSRDHFIVMGLISRDDARDAHLRFTRFIAKKAGADARGMEPALDLGRMLRNCDFLLSDIVAPDYHP